jgi:hypothetical protein
MFLFCAWYSYTHHYSFYIFHSIVDNIIKIHKIMLT